MKTNLPLKNLLKLSSCFCLAVGFFLLITFFIEGESLKGVLIKTFNALLIIILISMGNIGLLVLLDKKDPTQQSRKYTKGFYLISLLLSTSVILGIYSLNQVSG